MPSAGLRLAREFAASLVAVTALVALGLARLARVERPRAEVLLARDSARLERVTLGRRVVGYTLRCGGREVGAWLGERRPPVREGGAGGRRWIAVGARRIETRECLEAPGDAP